MKRFIYLFIILAISLHYIAYSKFNTNIATNSNSDTNFVFESPRPLLEDKFTSPIFYNNWGIDLSLSGSGFAFGAMFNFGINEDIQITTNILFSGARNTDEFEDTWDSTFNEYRVANKINRLFKVPISIGIKYFVLTEALGENFKPFLSAAASPTFIFSTPYDREFSMPHIMELHI